MHKFHKTLFSIIGITLFQSPYAVATPEQAESVLNKAQVASLADKQKAAEDAIKLDPLSGDAYSVLGVTKYLARDYDGAEAAFKKAIKLKPKNAFRLDRAYLDLYRCYIEQQNWKEALENCLACLKHKRTAGAAHDASLLYKKLGNMELSRQYATQAQDLDKLERATSTDERELYKNVKNPAMVDSVISDMNGKLAADPKDTRALSIRATCFETKKQYDKALADINAIIATKPSQGFFYYRRAELYKLNKDNKKAEADMKTAKERGFDIEQLKQNHAKVEALLNRLDSAEARRARLKKQQDPKQQDENGASTPRKN